MVLSGQLGHWNTPAHIHLNREHRFAKFYGEFYPQNNVKYHPKVTLEKERNFRMNFLEQLLSEWYEFHHGCFVMRNIKFGKGNNKGEIDILAYNPKTQIVYNIEASYSTKNKNTQKDYIIKKFKSAEVYYDKILNFPFAKLKKFAIVPDTCQENCVCP